MRDNKPAEVEGLDEPQSVRKLQFRKGMISERPDFIRDIADFHEKFGLEYRGKPRALHSDLAEFRRKFMDEELREWEASQISLDRVIRPGGVTVTSEAVAELLEDQLDALIDLFYVLLGTAYLQGFLPHFEEAWRRVHTANMAKVRKLSAEGETTDSGRAPKYDVVKPEGWKPPRHIDLCDDHAHK